MTADPPDDAQVPIDPPLSQGHPREPTTEGPAKTPFSESMRVYYSLLGALTTFVPLPFLDEWMLDQVRLRLYRGVLAHHGCDLPDDQLRLLALGPPRPVGCLRRLLALPCIILRKLVFWPIRFILRKLLFLLTLNDMSDILSSLYHRAQLLEHAAAQGLLDPETVRRNPDQVLLLYDAIDATCARFRTRFSSKAARGIRRTLRSSRRQIDQLALRLRRRLRGAKTDAEAQATLESPLNAMGPRPAEETEDLTPIAAGAESHADDSTIDRVVEELGRDLRSERGYFEHLRQTFDSLWEVRVLRRGSSTDVNPENGA